MSALALAACIDVGSIRTPTGSGGRAGTGEGGASGGGAGGTPAATNVCGNGAFACNPSCAGLASDCGALTESCCTSRSVLGGRFFRSYDGVTYTDLGYPATVNDFRLDKFEITVGRFRNFKAAWDAGWRPEEGAGKHTHLAGGSGLNTDGNFGFEPGWITTWEPDVAPEDANLACSDALATWTPSPGTNEDRPINCINWYEAYAFCIWDGGFLPSEAEWNYAAAGGAEQRAYPWSVPSSSTTSDCSYANYQNGDYCVAPGSGSTNDVGSESPKGDAKYGQADLAGNVWEWVLDSAGAYRPSCSNCASYPDSASNGVVRGGALNSTADELLVSARNIGFGLSQRGGGHLGARCARAPAANPTSDVTLIADQNGHYDGTNAAGVVGYWWSTSDYYGNDGTAGTGTCTADGFSAGECSFVTPTPGTFFRPDAQGRMCAAGTAAPVLPDATGIYAYSAIWGVIFGFNLNSPGPLTYGQNSQDGYDAPAHGITGFAFDIDAVPPGGHLQVAFLTPETVDNAAYWDGALMGLSPIMAPGHYEVRWADVGGPFYLVSPPMFDPTKIQNIVFHVVSTNIGPVDFDFCLSNLTLLTH
jgi:formylglycine-generating enzyme required for sulfatase activity